MKTLKPGIIILILLVGFVVYDAFFVIKEGRQAIVTQFGKPIGDPITDAGLNIKIPILQKVHLFEKRILKWDGEPYEIPTSDKTFIWVDTTARWRIVKPLVFMQTMINEDRAKMVLNDLIDGAVRDLVTKNNLIEVIRSSDWKKIYLIGSEKAETEEVVLIGRDRFSELVLQSIKDVTLEYGIELLDILIKRVNYTDTVREKVYERMISERKRIAAKKRSEGEGQKAEILGTVERELNNITSEAYEKAQTIRGQADAVATRIYGQTFSQDPEFYAFFISLDSYRKTMGKNSRLIIDTNTDLYKYLKGAKKK